MTIIKQRGVTSSGHQKNLRNYINDDRKVLLRDSQNMEECRDLKRWAHFMEMTRERFGHNKAARKGKNGKAAKNTILYHQILGFNPDECDVNGGTLTPEDCMRYAKEYVATYYPNQQVVLALHNEYCKADKTHRYAVHMVINRSDLKTGKRLDEGRGAKAKQMRAKRIRSMDGSWHLRQVERDKGNVSVHKKQPSKIERAIAQRGGKSYKTNLRQLCRLAATRAKDIFGYRELLESWGVESEFRNGRVYVTDADNARYSFSLSKLDAELASPSLEERLRRNGEGHPVETEREAYLREIRAAYLDYRKTAHKSEGTRLEDFPRLKLRRPPEPIANDPEVKRTVLAYWRGADELRAKMASEVPFARKKPEPMSGERTGQSRTRRQGPTHDGRADRGGERE